MSQATELDPRSPRARLTAFFDDGQFTTITPEDDRGVWAAVGRANGTHVVAFATDPTVLASTAAPQDEDADDVAVVTPFLVTAFDHEASEIDDSPNPSPGSQVGGAHGKRFFEGGASAKGGDPTTDAQKNRKKKKVTGEGMSAAGAGGLSAANKDLPPLAMIPSTQQQGAGAGAGVGSGQEQGLKAGREKNPQVVDDVRRMLEVQQKPQRGNGDGKRKATRGDGGRDGRDSDSQLDSEDRLDLESVGSHSTVRSNVNAATSSNKPQQQQQQQHAAAKNASYSSATATAAATIAATSATATTATVATAAITATTAAASNRVVTTERLQELLIEVHQDKADAEWSPSAAAAAASSNPTAAVTATTAAAAAAAVTPAVVIAPPTGPRPFNTLGRVWFPYTTEDGYDYFLTTDPATGEVHSQWEDPRTHGFIEEYAEEG